MIHEKKFCKGCGQRIDSQKSGILDMIMPKQQAPPQEFEDGWYCHQCAIEKVEKKRRTLK